MGDMGDDFRAMKDYRRKQRAMYGIECEDCIRLLPKALPGQKCKMHNFRAPRREDAGN